MQIKDFAVEQWMNEWETKCTHNVAETCVYSLTLDQLFELTNTDKKAWLDSVLAPIHLRRHRGAAGFLEGVARLYKTVEPGHIVPTHGATGANSLVISTLVEPGDHVVSVKPTYQQLYSIPEMCGAKVDILQLDRKNGLPRRRRRARCSGDRRYQAHLHQ